MSDLFTDDDLANAEDRMRQEAAAVFVRSCVTEAEEWIELAADIRAIDGNHDLGAGALAEALIERGWTRRSTP